MTVLELTIYILLGISFQIVMFAALAFYRHWFLYQDLKNRMVGFETGTIGASGSDDKLESATIGKSVSWQGFRNFRVVKKVFEDASRNVCSLHLEATDGIPLSSFKPGQFLTFQLEV